jgi:PAS domain S-box-containing protein
MADASDIDRARHAERRQALLACAEHVAQMGSWEYVPSEGELIWSDNLFRIFGLEPGEVTPTSEYVFEHTHPDDRERVETAVRGLEQRGELESLDYRISRPDGQRRHIRATLAVIERRGGRPHRLVGTAQDVTDSVGAEREIAAHIAVAGALVEWTALEPSAHRLLARLAGALDFVAGVFWVPRGDILVPRVLWRDGLVERPHFEAATRAVRMRRGTGLPGRVWTQREPLRWSSNDPTTTDPREPAAIADGLHGALAIPALMGEEVLAVVELKSEMQIELRARPMQSMLGIAHELGQFLARRLGELAEPLLTRREIQVLQLAAHGLSARETAEQLTVAHATIKTHLDHIYAKLEVSDKPSAVATGLRLGLIA